MAKFLNEQLNMYNGSIGKACVLVGALGGLMAVVGIVAKFQAASGRDEVLLAGGIEVSPGQALIVSDRPGAKRVEFRIRNVGLVDATIEQVGSSCSCVATKEISGTVLSPGDSILLPVEANVPHFGDRRTMISVVTSVGAAQVPIVMQGREEPLPSIISFPEKIEMSIDFGAVVGREVVQLVTKEKRVQPYWVRSISTSVPSCTARIDTVDEAALSDDTCRRTYSIVVEAGLPNQYEEFGMSWLVPVVAAGDRQFGQRCMLVSRRRSTIRLSPAAIVFRGDKSELSRLVALINDDANAPVVNAKSDSDLINAEIRPSNAGGSLQLRVSLVRSLSQDEPSVVQTAVQLFSREVEMPIATLPVFISK